LEKIETESDKYERGEHRAWEVYLHRLRQVHAEKGLPLSQENELRKLHAWCVKNWKTKDDFVLCAPCASEIRARGSNPHPAYLSLKQVMGNMVRNVRRGKGL